MNSLDHQSLEKKERISFYQYIEDACNAYGLDPGLIYALIHQQSGYDIEYRGEGGERGLLGLTKEQGKQLSLNPSDSPNIEQYLPYQQMKDERDNPAKSISATVNYLAKMLDKYRFDSKKSNLIKALYDFYTIDEVGNGNDRDAAVDSVAVLFFYYRKNDENIEKGLRTFYDKNNSVDPFFSSHSERVFHTPHQLAEETSYAQFEAYYYNNLALIYEANGEKEKAEQFYLKAVAECQSDGTIHFNVAHFYYTNGEYEKAYDQALLINNIGNPEYVLLKGTLSLIMGRYDEFSELYISLPKEIKMLPEVINLKGVYHYLINEGEVALDIFTSAVEKSNNPQIVTNYLAILYRSYFPNVTTAAFRELNTMTRSFATSFSWPNELRYVNSSFGWRPSPFKKTWKDRLENLDFHNGIDLPGALGLPVSSSADGEVTVSEKFPLGGESVFILHEDGFTSVYLHLDKRFVEVGEIVKQGDIIGQVGNTGASTGPHLHFGLYDNKWRPVNPLLYLPVYQTIQKKAE
jgi:tetratricopeptide (TPR) repeat protein